MSWLVLVGELVRCVGMLGNEPPGVVHAIAAAHWKQRVIVVLAPNSKQPDFQAQKRLLAGAAPGLRERDVLVLYRLHGELQPPEASYLHTHYGLRVKGFEVVLLGKDGTVKLHRQQPVAPAGLFGLIDQMPMRQQEMRGQQ